MTPVSYFPNFIENAPKLFDYFWNNLPWERRSDAPRRECWMNDFSRPYTYGRGAGERTYYPVAWDTEASAIRAALEAKIGCYFEACFINGYEGQGDHLGWHADDSDIIDHARPIAIVSFGAAREIWFREIGSSDINKQLLENGSLLVMSAGMQHTHQHRIPKNSAKCDPRVSLTYRALL